MATGKKKLRPDAEREAELAGSVKSLRKLISDVNDLLRVDKLPDADGEMRLLLFEHLNEFAKRIYKNGYRMGHKDSRQKFDETGMFPNSVSGVHTVTLFSARANVVCDSNISSPSPRAGLSNASLREE